MSVLIIGGAGYIGSHTVKYFLQQNEDIIVVASDNYFSFELDSLYKYYRSINEDCVVGSYANQETLKQQKYAVALLNEANKIIDFEEKPQNPKSNIIIHAIYIYKKETLPLFKQYIEEGNNHDAPGNFPAWLYTKKPVYCYQFTGFCYDIGTIDSYNELNK